MPKKREIIIATSFFLIGLISTCLLFLSMNRKKFETNRLITLDIIDNCINIFEINDALINNCSEAYSEVANCFSDLNSCDVSMSAQKLEKLDARKRAIQTRLENTTKEIDFIIAKKKSL